MRAWLHRLAHRLSVWPAEVAEDDRGWWLRCVVCGHCGERNDEGAPS